MIDAKQLLAELQLQVRHIDADLAEQVREVLVPPRYGSGDFLRTSYWSQRGKLDVPKERFVSYPAASRDGDGSLLLGWAGWDHREQAQTLAVLVGQRRGEDSWGTGRMDSGCRAMGVRSAHPPRWTGPTEVELEHGRVRVVPCVSVLAVLDALADPDADGRVTVILTDLPEQELGDAVLARVHRRMLLEADRYSLLADLLGARALDPRIRAQAWLVDALIALAESSALPPATGATVSLRHAVALVAAARLGVEPDRADLPDLISAFDDTRARTAWRGLPADERAGIVAGLEDRLGPGTRVVAALAERHDDVLAELLVAQVLTAAPASDPVAAPALGGYTHSRFETPRPSRAELLATADPAMTHARNAPLARRQQQARLAEIALEELGGTSLVALSPILPRGFVDRLARAAQTSDTDAFDAVDAHQLVHEADHRVSRVRAAARLRRWLGDAVQGPGVSTVAEGLTAHARELAWVDRALVQVRAGDADSRIATILEVVGRQVGARRASVDEAFATALARVDSTPTTALAVETVLPRVVAPLARTLPVLLVVVDGMSGAVATDLTEQLADPRTGWTEMVRSPSGTREAILAALPTETRYSRTSLFCAALRSGDQAVERSAFASHAFWPSGGAVLLHKADVRGRHGADLGDDLEAAVRADGPRVVGVVLNAVDDSLAKGRQSLDPAWRPEDVAGLPQLLDRAAAAGRAVLLTSDHGHVLEHGAEHRSHGSGGARWRPDDGAPRGDEVTVSGPRMLADHERVILPATEDVRYGARAHGYHGGATLAEAAIPLIGLLPPVVSAPEGWVESAPVPPSWWDGIGAPEVPTPALPARPRKPFDEAERGRIGCGPVRPAARASQRGLARVAR